MSESAWVETTYYHIIIPFSCIENRLLGMYENESYRIGIINENRNKGARKCQIMWSRPIDLPYPLFATLIWHLCDAGDL